LTSLEHRNQHRQEAIGYSSKAVVSVAGCAKAGIIMLSAAGVVLHAGRAYNAAGAECRGAGGKPVYSQADQVEPPPALVQLISRELLTGYGVALASIHPDGKRLLTSIAKRPHDIWILEGFDQQTSLLDLPSPFV
jgi:hypothetical protein